MQKWYIIRHGETEFNRLNIVQGCGVDTDLNDKGLMQADAFFDAYKDFPFDHVYTSALKRSYQSVRKFIEKGIAHSSLQALNEISWGDFEGKLQSEEQKEIYREIVRQWNEGMYDAKIPNGESAHELRERQMVAVHQILQQNQSENILICMHGRAMKSFICLLLGEPPSKMEEFQHTNLGLYLLGYDGEKFMLLKRNDTDHLY